MRTSTKIGLGIVGLLTVGAVATASQLPQPGATTPTATTRAADQTEGTLAVPRDIKPGTYAATVPADSLNCYWARLRDLNGDLDSIAANGNVRPGGKVTVHIKGTDQAFETTGCGTWRKVK